MNKRILSLTLAGVIAFGTMGTAVYADSGLKEVAKSAKVEDKKEDERVVVEKEEIKVELDGKSNINIPVIKGLSDKKYEEKLNNIIKSGVEKELESFKQEAGTRKDNNSELFIDYEVKLNDRVLSIILTNYKYFSGDANGETKIDYYNVDINNNKDLTLDKLFKDGVDYKKIIDKEIKNQISVRDDDLLEGEEGFKGINKDQAFYINEYGDLVIGFAEYEIGPKSVGSPEFIISIDSIIEEIRPEMVVKPLVLGKVIEVDVKDEARASVPEIKGLSDSKVEEELNKLMNDVVLEEVNEFKKQVKEDNTDGKAEFEVSYDVKNDGNVISIIIESFKSLPGMANTESNKYYFNIDVDANKILKIKDLFKEEAKYIEFINKEIKSQIEEEKENYFKGEDGFTGIVEDQDFYLDGSGNIVIEFNKYEIAPGSTGRPKFIISGYKVKDMLKEEYAKAVLKSLDEVVINGSKLKLEKPMYISNTGVVMMPLAEMSKALGFQVKWDSKTEVVTLIHDELKVLVSTRENEYKFNDALVVMENGAKIKDGNAYVPQDFLDIVLYSRVDILDGFINIKY